MKIKGVSYKNFNVLHDKVLVLLPENSGQSKGGILLVKEPSKMDGTVVGLGSKEDYQVKIGDKIAFSPTSGTELKFDDGTCKILSEDDIIGTLTHIE